MPRARLLTTTVTLAVAATALTGCGGGAEGPAPSNLPGSSRPASQEIESGSNTLIDRVFGSYETPSAVQGDTSIADSVTAGYSSVPGASVLDDTELGSLSMDSDPFDSVRTRTLDVGDSGLDTMGSQLDTMGMDSDPFSSIDAPSYDSAFMDAQERYGSGSAIDDMSFDTGMAPMMDDPSLDAGMEDPMLDDPTMDMGTDPSMDMGMDDPTLDF